MVKIRLMRVGKRKQPSFRVVVADSRSPRDGRIIEAIGHYHPRHDPSVVEVDNERAVYWLRNGAQASDSVRQILRISGAWSEFTGEAPLTGPPPERKKATPAASVTAAESTPADEADEAAEAEATPADEAAQAAGDEAAAEDSAATDIPEVATSAGTEAPATEAAPPPEAAKDNE